MKKQTLAKLIILGMVAAMLPISALAADSDQNDDTYPGTYTENPSVTPGIDDVDSSSNARPQRPNANGTSSGKEDSSSDTTTDTTTTPTESAGTVAVNAQVSGSTATVSVSADQITSQIDSASGAVVVDVQSTGSATEVSANVPSAALQAVVDGGVDLSIKSAVGTVTVSNADLAALVEAAGGAEVSISLKVEGGTLEVSILAGDTAITDLTNGVAVAIPAGSYTTATQTDDDGNEVELTVSIADGVMTLTLFNTSPVHLS